METRNLHGRRVPLLGYGCMRFPTLGADNKIDYEKSQKLIDHCMESGIYYFDTAYVYHGGESENFVRQALSKYKREDYLLADKLPIWMCKTPEDVERIFEEQLQKCGVSYFDVYLVHAVERKRLQMMRDCGAYEVLCRKKEEGKIKNLGFSFHDTPEILKEMVTDFAWDVVQLQLNYLDWEAQRGREQYEILRERGIPCVVMEPLRGGYLANPAESVAAVFNNADNSKTPASYSLRWLAGLDGVATILSGMTTMENLMENIQTLSSDVLLSKEEYALVKKAIEQFKKVKTVPCTACNYCKEVCPQNINIPKIFELYNRLVAYKEIFWVKHTYEKVIEPTQKPQYCIECGLCTAKCPQHIEIPENLKAADQALTEE